MATLTAFSPDGRELGSIQQENISRLQGPFVGIETSDSEGISLLVVSFGNSGKDEQINDLRFDLLAPHPFLAYLPQVVSGTTGSANDIRIRFKDSAGTPLELNVEGETVSSLEFHSPGPLPITRLFAIEGDDELKVG